MSIEASDIEVEVSGETTSLLTPSKTGKAKVAGSSWYASVFLVVNAALGAGLLNFPDAYRQAGGVAVAIIIQAIFLVFVIGAVMVLAYCSNIGQAATYQDTVYTVSGKKAQLFCSLTIAVYCFGTCITFLIIIGDQWEEFFLFVARSTYCNSNPWYMQRTWIIISTSILLILPLCFPRRIDFLKYASAVGVVGILYVVMLVIIKYFTPHDPPGRIRTSPEQWVDVFLVIPTICFAYQFHVSIIPIYSCMGKRTLKEFAKTVSVATILCVINYTGTAAFGYLTFGENITSDILLSYDPSPEVIIAVVLIAVKTYTTYPILLFCGRAAFDCLWFEFWKMTPEQILNREKVRRITITCVWFFSTLGLSVLIPNIGVVIQFLGAFAAVFIFIFPGLCLLRLILQRVDFNSYWSKMDKFLAFTGAFIITLGIFLFFVTLIQAIMEDAAGDFKSDKSKYACT
ncbi:hypothetical protein ScPMuIL_001210 [Solemya velum]